MINSNLIKDYLIHQEGAVNPVLTDIDDNYLNKMIRGPQYIFSYQENGDGIIRSVNVHTMTLLEFIYNSTTKIHYDKS